MGDIGTEEVCSADGKEMMICELTSQLTLAQLRTFIRTAEGSGFSTTWLEAIHKDAISRPEAIWDVMTVVDKEVVLAQIRLQGEMDDLVRKKQRLEEGCRACEGWWRSKHRFEAGLDTKDEGKSARAKLIANFLSDVDKPEGELDVRSRGKRKSGTGETPARDEGAVKSSRTGSSRNPKASE